MTPNETSYGFSIKRPLDLVAPHPGLPNPAKARVSAADAVSFAQMSQKIHYDRQHKPMYMKTGDYAYLRLHKGYNIPSTELIGKKLSQQYVGPFKIIGRVGSLAYKLDIPDHWRLNPVFTIAQLEPAPGPDPFNRPIPDEPDSVFVEGDTPDYKSYVIKSLLDKRTYKRGR